MFEWKVMLISTSKAWIRVEKAWIDNSARYMLFCCAQCTMDSFINVRHNSFVSNGILLTIQYIEISETSLQQQLTHERRARHRAQLPPCAVERRFQNNLPYINVTFNLWITCNYFLCVITLEETGGKGRRWRGGVSKVYSS